MELKIQIKNFKSIQSATIPLKTGLNILVGPNGSGKSCICSALAFLHDLLLHGAAQAVAHAGGPKTVYHRGRRQLQFRIVHDYGKRICRNIKCPFWFEWSATISQSGKDGIAAITWEEFSVYANHPTGKVRMFQVTSHRPKGKTLRFKTYLCDPSDYGKDLLSFWSMFSSRDNKSRISKRFRKHLRDFVAYFKEVPDKSVLVQAAFLDSKVQEVVRYLQSLNEYNILPDVARSPTEQLPFAVMRPDGEGAAQVIHALEQGDYYRIESASNEATEEIPFFYVSRVRRQRLHGRRLRFYHLDLFRSERFARPRGRVLEKALESIQAELAAGVKPIEAVATAIDQTSGKRYLLFQSAGSEFRPEEVSDGTVKWLCILVSIYVPHSPLYVLEEPENFLHPWMQQRLVATMREQAQGSDTIFLLTSHSQTILNATEPREMLVVTPSAKGTRVQQIPNRDEIEKILAESEFRLGDLWVSGAISGVPTHDE
ncbi:MAG: AAA family ATPase [candidate division Zixibacteria bacterium]|nr:AAA family ATPase [candidate division Zixibacteria bacterium]